MLKTRLRRVFMCSFGESALLTVFCVVLCGVHIDFIGKLSSVGLFVVGIGFGGVVFLPIIVHTV